METRIVFRVYYFKDQEQWDYGLFDTKDFVTIEEAMEFGKRNERDWGFQVQKWKQTWQHPPLGKVWRNQAYGWTREDEIDMELVYDGNRDYKIELKG